jgi:hypothetical protein
MPFFTLQESPVCAQILFSVCIWLLFWFHRKKKDRKRSLKDEVYKT